ncbi:uncharacterized protein LOC112589692 [Harpegnathos saltator]|uniref:uncharacterized protein LOC112588684 n=1 Tax=Harpegnathos saltator TaxID=610380 RepID=UPI000DBEEE6D|nr:uncharacterized protein LOC112588684 [Harpegnathos saltator]XP_025159799.1 uncharacterized protein LOC112589692 [Harpegnathos saltator]
MEKHVNLLHIPDPRDDDNAGHFAWIKNLSRLVSSQLSKKEHKKHICYRCLHYFSSSEKLENHTVDCQKMNNCAIILPNDDNKWLSFTNYCRKERIPFIVYADLERILEKTPREEQTSSYAYQHHSVFSIAYYVPTTSHYPRIDVVAIGIASHGLSKNLKNWHIV